MLTHIFVGMKISVFSWGLTHLMKHIVDIVFLYQKALSDRKPVFPLIFHNIVY